MDRGNAISSGMGKYADQKSAGRSKCLMVPEPSRVGRGDEGMKVLNEMNESQDFGIENRSRGSA